MRGMEDEIRRLRLENEIPEKSGGLLRSDAAVASRCAFIESEKANYDFTFMCRMLSVPRSSFYTSAASCRFGHRGAARGVGG